MKETGIIPYNLQGFAVHAAIVEKLEEMSKKLIVDFVNFIIQNGTEDLDNMDRSGKVFFTEHCQEELKEFVAQLIVGTVPSKLRVIFSDVLANSCTYSTTVTEGIKSMYRLKIDLKLTSCVHRLFILLLIHVLMFICAFLELLRGLFNHASNGLTDGLNKNNMKIIFISEVTSLFRRECRTWKVNYALKPDFVFVGKL